MDLPIETLLAEIENPEVVENFREMMKIGGYPGYPSYHSIVSGGRDDLKSLCQEFVAEIDSGIFEERREGQDGN